jgi:hypothetical protein
VRGGFVVAPEKSLDLGNSCSWTESIDVFSKFEDLVLRDVGTDRQEGQKSC